MIGALIASAVVIVGAVITFAVRTEHRLTRIETLILNGNKRPRKIA